MLRPTAAKQASALQFNLEVREIDCAQDEIQQWRHQTNHPLIIEVWLDTLKIRRVFPLMYLSIKQLSHWQMWLFIGKDFPRFESCLAHLTTCKRYAMLLPLHHTEDKACRVSCHIAYLRKSNAPQTFCSCRFLRQGTLKTRLKACLPLPQS